MKLSLSMIFPFFLIFFANCIECNYYRRPGMHVTPGHINQIRKMGGGHPGKGR